jgi:IMP dehydrogenase|tara:strand:- start:3140 stop:4195 length:1056 start_codon:yes stop_codon:yes gene_type:complete
MNRALTFDDINISPKYSELKSRSDIDLTTRFTKNTKLMLPIISSPMDTITEHDMALEMMKWGGVGIIHRFMSIEKQTNEIQIISNANKRHLNNVRDITQVPICAAIGVVKNYLERAQELVYNGCNVLVLDVAHGHHKLVKKALGRLKNELKGNVEIVGGSIATRKAAKDLCEWGADGLRVGIGNGSLCETRIRTGVGIPSVTALLDVCAVADSYNVPVIADGGIRNIGDVCKGLGCGADAVMLGSLLSGTKETPGEISKVGQWPNEQLYKKYRGSASLDSKLNRGENKNVEGNSKLIPYKGKIKRIINDITDGLRSSCSYVGASNLGEYRSLVEFVKITNAGIIEAKPHLL